MKTTPKILPVLAAALAFGTASTAQQTLNLPEAFAPEGIAVDAGGTMYLGSLTQGRVISLNPETNQIEPFAAAGVNGMVSVIGLHISADNALVFACSSDLEASQFTGTAAPALVAFVRATGEAAGRYELPEDGGFCNDITELPDGTILATDSFSPRIYALRPEATALEIWFEDAGFTGEGFNLNGIAYADGSVYFVRYNTGTLHGIPVTEDSGAGSYFDVTLPAPLAAPDGLTALGHGRFLVVEGGGLTAGARGQLSGLRLENGAAMVTVIAPDLNIPTTAAVFDGVAYVVEGQLDHLFDPDAGAPDPYRVLKINLPSAFQ